jgi:phosphate-selective porin OprO and OprP
MLHRNLVYVLIAGAALLLAVPRVAVAETGETLETETTAMTRLEETATETADEKGEAKKGEAGWKKKAYFKTSDGKFSLELGSRVQFRYTQDDPDGGDSTGSFRIRRAKFALSGVAYEYWKYKIQAVWSGGSTSLEDAYLQYTKNKKAQLWLGQGKVFFGRQELTSSGKQQFVDRSITSGRFAPGRDQGIALLGTNENKTFEYNLGVYNGNGRNRSSDDNSEKMIIGRAVWTPFGAYKLEESSLDYPDSGKLALGGSYLSTTEGNGPGETDITRYGIEFAYKLHGFNTVGEYYTEEADTAGVGSLDTDGYYVQVGYLFPNKRFEVAGRYAVVSPDVPFNADEIETGIAFSYYLKKHDYKVQADFRNIENEVSNTEDREIRVQLQLAF